MGPSQGTVKLREGSLTALLVSVQRSTLQCQCKLQGHGAGGGARCRNDVNTSAVILKGREVLYL